MFIARGERINYEYELVDLFIQEYTLSKLLFSDWVSLRMYQEVRVPEISRRSDIVLMTDHGRVINVEFKLNDLRGVFKQAKDHKKWADYSVVCMPANAFAQESAHFIGKFIEEGIGVLLYAGGKFIEIVKPYNNTYKSGKQKSIRMAVIHRLNSQVIRTNIDNKNSLKIINANVPTIFNEKNIGVASLVITADGGITAKICFSAKWNQDNARFTFKASSVDSGGITYILIEKNKNIW